jgi:hypothetical protein
MVYRFKGSGCPPFSSLAFVFLPVCGRFELNVESHTVRLDNCVSWKEFEICDGGTSRLEAENFFRYYGARVKLKVTCPQIAGIIVGVVVFLFIAHYDEWLPRHWETYVSPDGAFSIELPGKAILETSQAPLEGGGTMFFYTVSVAPSGSSAFSLAYVENKNVAEKSPDQALESARDGSLRNIQGTLITQNRITVQGFPGLEMQAHARGNSFLDSRLLVVGDRLYIIMVVAGSEQDREPKTVQRIFDSFKLIPK